MTPNMTSDQALQLVDSVCASVSLSRADHSKVQLAIQTLSEAIAKPKTEDKKGK